MLKKYLLKILGPPEKLIAYQEDHLVIMSITILVSSTTFLSIGLFHLVKQNFSAPFYVCLMGVVLVITSMTYQRLNNFSINKTSIFFITGIAALLYWLCYSTGGIKSPATPWLIVLPITLGLLSGKTGSVIGGLQSVTILTVLLYLHYSGIMPDSRPHIPDKDFHLNIRALYVTTIMITILVYLSQRTIEKSFEKVQKNSADIQGLLQVIGHDISNPLSIIINSSKRALKISKEVENYRPVTQSLERIDRASLVIKDIITQIKEIQALDKGKVALRLGNVDIKNILEHSTFVLSDKLQQKNISIKIIDNLKNTSLVRAEPISLANQVFNNIISNAIKFSNKGGKVIITLQDSCDYINIIITDSGIGIPDDIIKNLFETSKITTRPGTSGEKGTGFGMPLVKRYMNYYKGTISVQSKSVDKYPSEHGTTFKLSLIKAYPATSSMGKDRKKVA